MSLNVKLWGCRGSLPTPKTPDEIKSRISNLLEQFSGSGQTVSQFISSKSQHELGGFGGHTACIQCFTDKTSLIIDGGSGIRPYGAELLKGPCGLGKGEVNILFTHFHWDHLVGLPFFVPIFIPGNKINLYAVQDDLEEVIRTVFRKPYFPVPFEALGADITFNKLEPRQPKEFGDMTVTPYELDHPDPCWGYRVEHEKKSFAYCVDTEATRMSQADLGEDIHLYKDADLMVFDAQYTFKEATERINWGHATGPVGLDLAMREKVKRAYFVHHDPAASDEKIAEAEQQTRDYYNSKLETSKKLGREVHELDWSFAHEGMILKV